MSSGTEHTASGVIEEIDDGVARILIGDGDDAGEWYYPLTALPDEIGVGSCLWFAEQEGRWVPLGRAQERPDTTTRSIEQRLGRQRQRPDPRRPSDG